MSLATSETEMVRRKKELRKIIESFKSDHVRLLNSVTGAGKSKRHFDNIAVQGAAKAELIKKGMYL